MKRFYFGLNAMADWWANYVM